MRKAIVMIIVVLAASDVATAVELGQKCQADKNGVAGKLATCLSKAERKSVFSADASTHARAVESCSAAFATKWSRLEQTAVDGGSQCPSMNDQQDIHELITACSNAVADAVAGKPLPLDPVQCAIDLDVCTAAR